MVKAKEKNKDPTVDVAEGEIPEKDGVPKQTFADARSILEELHVHIKQFEELDSSNEGRDGVFSSGLVSILKLRKSHRSLCELVERFREQTAGVKSELDASSLHLQNLLYQKNHYQREIQACRSYASAYSDAELELVTEEEYLRDADVQQDENPNNEKVVAESMEDKSEAEEGALEAMDVEENEEDQEHVMRLRRLRHEVHRRKVSLQELPALKLERDTVAAELAKQRNTLSAIDAEVARLKQSVQRSLSAFEGDMDGNRALNVFAEEFVMPQ